MSCVRSRSYSARIKDEEGDGPGESGPDSGEYTAGAALSGHKVVRLSGNTALYASNASLSHLGRAVGITTGAASMGAPVTVQHGGELSEPSWNWDVSLPVYLGANGALTQSVPTLAGGAVFIQIIGVPTDATTLFIDLREPVALA